jgi:hypothetical protein
MIIDPDFTLDLGHSWERVPDDDPRLYKFLESSSGMIVVIRATTVDVPPHQMDDMANLLLDLRISGERERAAAAGLNPIIYEPIVVPQPWGRATAFYGHDEAGRQFGFSSFVTGTCMISLYGSSSKLSQQELLEMMDEVLAKIEFDRTPLDTALFLH